MAIEESIHVKQKLFLIRGGDARVFGENSAERRRMDDNTGLLEFSRVWDETLADHVEAAPEIGREEAEEMLDQACKSFAIEGYTYRLFSIEHAAFIARIHRAGHCDQLWPLGAHRDSTRLCVYFDSTEERKLFEALAVKLGWNSRTLGLRLLTDFMNKFPENWQTK